MKITSIVLAGGKSRRMGRRKALESIDGKSLIEHVVERIRPFSSEVLVVTCQELQDFPDACEARVLVDIHRGKGPLAGIYRGLLDAQSEYSLVVACDMPFLSTGLLRHMTDLANGYDAVVPRLSAGTMEPLHAIYSKACLGEMKRRLDSDRLGIDAFLKMVRVRYVECDECQRYDPKLLSFTNLNYQSDLERAIMLASVDIRSPKLVTTLTH